MVVATGMMHICPLTGCAPCATMWHQLEEGPGRSPPHVEVPCQDEDWKEEAEGNLATELAASLLARSHSDAHGVWENVRREVRRLVAVTRGARELVHAAHLALR